MRAAGSVFDIDDEPTFTHTTRDGETLPVPPFLAKAFALIDAQRAQERLDYCLRHGLDPEMFTGCYACEGTGIHTQTQDTCWCDYGATVQRQREQKAEDEFWAKQSRLHEQKAS